MKRSGKSSLPIVSVFALAYVPLSAICNDNATLSISGDIKVSALLTVALVMGGSIGVRLIDSFPLMAYMGFARYRHPTFTSR